MIDPVSGMDMSQFAAPPTPQGDIPAGTPMMRITPQATQESSQAKGVDPVSGIDFDTSQFPPIPAPPVKATAGGMMRNVGAGLQEGAAGTMNVLSDPFGNLVGKPLLTAGGFVHDALAPVFGYQRLTPEQRADLSSDDVPQPGTRLVNAFDRAVGMPPPDQIPANGTAEQLARKGASAATGMVGLGPGGPLLNAAVGAGGAIAGDQAARFVPEWAQPMTEMAANVLGNLGAAGIAHVGAKLVNSGLRAAGNFGIGPKETVGGTQATAAQANTVGQQLLKAAGPEGQDALNAALSQPGMGPSTEQLVPGAQPTTAQAMAGEGIPPQGIAEMDKAARVANPAEYNTRAAAQNNAMVGVIRNPAGDISDTAEPAMLGQFFTKQLQDIDAQHAGDIAAGQAQLGQEAAQATGAARGAVQGATQAVGGTTAPDVTGSAIRGSLMERNAGARSAESGLWQSIDPEGKLTLPLGDVQQTARGLMKDIDPNLGDQLGPQESMILKGAAALPDVVPFKDAQRLRSNIGQAERTLRAAPGNEQSLRRLGMLKSSLDDAIANGATTAAANDPEIAARLQTLGASDGATGMGERGNSVSPAGAIPGAVGGENGLSGQGGAGSAQGSGPGGASGNRSVAAATATEGVPEPGMVGSGAGGLEPNFNAEAAGRYAAARQATLERKQTFGQGPVGAAVRPGKQGAEFNVENAAVAKQFLTGGSTEPARVQKFIEATGGEPQATAAMREALVSDLRQKRVIDEDGMVKADRLKGWLAPEARGRTVDLFPGLRDQLGTAETAQRTYDQTVADHAARLDAFNKQAALDHIEQVSGFKKTGGQFVESEPVDALKRLFASKTRAQDFADVVNRARDNPEVLDGLKRLTADYIEQRFSGAKPSGEDTDFLKAAQFRKFIDDRREPLKVIFGGQGVQNLEMVAADLRRQAAATAAPATPGPDTAQKLHGLAKMGLHAGGGGMATTAFALIGEHLVEHLGTLASHSALVAAIAAPVGIFGGLLANTLRQAGIKTRSDLVREAMLNPAVAKELMSRASSKNAISQISQRRIARAIQASIVNNAVGQDNQGPTK